MNQGEKLWNPLRFFFPPYYYAILVYKWFSRFSCLYLWFHKCVSSLTSEGRPCKSKNDWTIVEIFFFFYVVSSVQSTLHTFCHLTTVTNQIVQFNSVTQSCPTRFEPIDCSTPGFLVHYQLLELTQTHVHWVGDAVQPPHSLSSPSPPDFNLSQP